MGTSNLPEKDELEIQMQKRITELEKANQDLRAENMALNRDITKHKRAEEESGQNEKHFGLKLENNLSTSRKAENLELAEIIDIQAVQSIMDDFYKFAHITMALLDLKGNILIGVGWQDICTRFHRVHPETCKHCVESDTKLSAGVPPGEFKLYRCKNNMWDIVTPIIVAGQHVGNIFSGQFFFDDEPVDYELFRTQARKYGFNEEEYIAALEKVPRLSRETVENSMSFFMKLANMLSQLSHSNIKLAQSLEERNTLVDDLDRAQAVGNVGSWRLNAHKNELTWSDENHRIFGIPKGTPLTYETFLSTVHPGDREYVNKEWKEGLKGKPYDIEHRIIVDGKIKWVREKAYLEFDKDGAVVSGFGITQDITERRQAEHQLSNELARATGLYELYTRSSNLSDRELYDFALNQAVKITDSTIGFFHLISEDEKEIILTTWNQEALRSCTAGNEGHYPIEKAGNWVDCVRLKRPVVYNDFPSSPNQKGLPAGHAAVKRFMSVPVTENGKVRIIFGVGNKVDEYDDRDVMQLQLVANELHKIMKLRRIENEVRESEAFLRDIMENVSDAIFVKDREARMILANPAYYRLMGESPEEVLNKTAADFHPPEIARKLAEDDKRVMETGKGTTLEERIFTSHGWRILQTVKAPYYDGQGNIIGLIGAARDITERKKAEEALKKAHGNLEKLVEERTAELEKAYNSLKESEIGLAEAQKMAHIGNWDWNLVNGGGYWSNELYHIFGRSPQKSAPFYDELFNYIHPDDREYVEKSIQNGLKEGPKSGIDYRIVLANGEERTVHSQAEVIFDEQKIPVRVKGIVQDITERKRIEAELELVARLPQENPDPVMRLNQGRIINYANPSAQVLLTDWGSAISKEAPREITELSVAALGDGIRRKLECTYANRIYMIDIAPFPGAGYVNLYAHDITESKKAKEALEKIDKIRIKEIHHRIKNNLQVISSLLDLQAEKFRNKEVLEAFRESQNRVTSMSLIHEELYKGEGNDTLNFSAYLQKLVESLFQTYSLSSKNVRLCMDLEENTLFNMDVAVPLGIIVNELVSNSLKHAFAENKEGEVRIKLRREEKGNEMHKSFFSLSISDNGKGIPESIKLESLESLGLQLVNILVDQLDGKTELKRTHGTEFRITFNVAERS